jgi:glucose/arabinose dehydrogenase
MKTMRKMTVVGTALVLMLIADVPLLPVQLVPEAHAILGVRRRSVAVGYAAGSATATAAAQSQQSAAAQQQAATAQQQSATAQQQSATAQQQAAAAAAAGKPLPLGTVVAALPPGCTSTPVGGVEYHSCGGNFYRAVFQGNSLVYVTAQP